MSLHPSKLWVTITNIALIVFCFSYVICGFFDLKGQEFISHITGSMTMIGCFFVGISFLKFPIRNKLFKILGCLSNLGMSACYFLYLFHEISPSNLQIISHAASSMSLDITTLGESLTNLLALVIIGKEINNKCK